MQLHCWMEQLLDQHPTSQGHQWHSCTSHCKQQVEWDGYDSDPSVDHNAAIHSKGPLEVDEPDIPETGE